MGRDKAELTIDGTSLLGFMRTKLSSGGLHPVYISHADHISDIYPDKGPLSGLHAVLCQAPLGSHIIFVPVDMPMIPEDALREIARAPKTLKIVRLGPCPLPVRICADHNVCDQLERRLQTAEDLSLKGFQADMNCAEIPIKPEWESGLSSLNTPKDWQSFKAAQK
jgi:molybdopterin-guanine dinucleotide biosynthesis protein A